MSHLVTVTLCDRFGTQRSISAVRLIGELSSSLGASSLKNFSSVSGSHSLSKAVFLASLSLLRLIGSFHR